MNEIRKQVLGRGLSSLFSSSEAEQSQQNPNVLPLEDLIPGENQPRRSFVESELLALTSSIKEKGVLLPILVRAHPVVANKYEIVAGERRWRASKLAGLTEIPVLIKTFTDAEVLEVGLLENIQRQDLNPIEEAAGYHRLAEEFQYTQEALSRIFGKSRSYVTNCLRLLTLPQAIQTALIEGTISAGHGRALVGCEQAEALLDRIIEKGLSVRETEDLTRKNPSAPKGRQFINRAVDPELNVLQQHLSDLLDTPVDLLLKGTGGKMIIHFKDTGELDELIRKLNG
jgi:ParB family chromosome partitioning protein